MDTDDLLEHSEKTYQDVNGLEDKLEKTNSEQMICRYETDPDECSIRSCLNQFTDLEVMDGNNLVACKTCTERERVCEKVDKKVYSKHVTSISICCFS